MGFQLRLELFLGKRAVLHLGTLRLGLANGTRVKTKLDLLTTLVVRHVGGRNSLHPEDLDLVPISSGKCVLDSGEADRWSEKVNTGD